jgi:hypothetical protein
MLPDLPVIDPKVNGARSGWLLNRLVERIRLQRLVTTETVSITDTASGQIISRIGGAGVAPAFALGFAVAIDGNTVTVAPGRVTTPSWGLLVASDPVAKDWAAEANFVGGSLTNPVTEVWLQIGFAESDTPSYGALGTSTIDISGASGGRGGGGGGGASMGGDWDDERAYSTNGETGQDGDAFEFAGVGGLGGLPINPPDDMAATQTGQGKNGGPGGNGGAGGAGGSVTFTQKTKAEVVMRRWSLGSISIHTAKGTASQESAWIHLATISSGSVEQHVAGVITVAPPAISFID